MRKVSAEYFARYNGEPDLIFSEDEGGQVWVTDAPLAPASTRWASAPSSDWDVEFYECSHGHAFCSRHG